MKKRLDSNFKAEANLCVCTVP